MKLSNGFKRIGYLGIENQQVIFDLLKITFSTSSISIDGDEILFSIKSTGSWNVQQSVSKKISWDGSDEYIYLSQDSGSGNASILISSDQNNGHRRSKNIDFVATNDKGKSVTKTITISQFGIYNGLFATTPASEYVRGLDGGNALQL